MADKGANGHTDTQFEFLVEISTKWLKIMRDFFGGEIHISKGSSKLSVFPHEGWGVTGVRRPHRKGCATFSSSSPLTQKFSFLFFFLLALPSLNLTFSRQHHFQHFETLFATISARFFPPFFKPLAPKTCSSPRNRPRPRDRPFFGGTLHTLWGWKIQFQQQQQQQRFSRSLFRINTLTNTNSLSLNSR